MYFTALAVNETLRCFLRYLLDNAEQFDESGVYKLFRIVLKLQEHVGELKKQLNVDASVTLIKDARVWCTAEAVLQVLNTAIFMERSALTPKVATSSPAANGAVGGDGSQRRQEQQQSGSDALRRFGDVNLLNDVEKTKWANMASCRTTRDKSGALNFNNLLDTFLGPPRYKRHKGTVFASLQIDTRNL